MGVGSINISAAGDGSLFPSQVFIGEAVENLTIHQQVVGTKASGWDTYINKLQNLADLPTDTSRRAAFSPDGAYMAVAHYASPFITIYKQAGDTFTKLPNPASLPAGAGNGCSFSPDGMYLAVAHDGHPFVTIYKTFTKHIISPTTLYKAGLVSLYSAAFGGLGFSRSSVDKGDTAMADMLFFK